MKDTNPFKSLALNTAQTIAELQAQLAAKEMQLLDLQREFDRVIIAPVQSVADSELMRLLSRFPAENPDPVLRIDLKGCVVVQNSAAKNIDQIRWKDNTYEPKTFWEVISKETIATKEAFTVGAEMNNRNIEFRVIPFDDHIQIYGRDVTDLKLTSVHLQNLVEHIHSGLLVENENRVIIQANQHFCDLFAIPFPPSEFTGLSCEESAEQSKHLFRYPQSFLERISYLLHKKETVTNDVLELKDGRFFERDFIPIYIENSYRGVLWNYRDITQRKRNEAAILHREEKYRSIIANMNLGLLEVDLEERILFANQQFCEMSGYNQTDLIGKVPSVMFLRGKDSELIRRKAGLRKDGKSDTYELSIWTGKNEIRWWLISGAPLYNDQGEHIGSIGIHLDITEQKELEKNLEDARFAAEESSKAKEIFLANMSHELRTPMNGILGMLRQMRKSPKDQEQSLLLNNSQHAAEHLLNILNDILDLSRIESGKLHIEKIGFSVEEVVRRAIAVTRPRADEKSLNFNYYVDHDISPILIGDPHRLNQILLNLVGNAIKFTDKGEVSLKARLDGTTARSQQITFEITDTGIGMDQLFIDNAFDPFHQEDSSIARKYGGTGLGLNITRQLLQLMDGRIAIESAKQKGTKIFVSINFFIGKEADLPDAPILITESDELRNKRLLLVEDNELNRQVAMISLKHFGAIVTQASNGLEAIDWIRQEPFDLILMDVQMPIMDGYEAARVIRQELNSSLPIIAITANALTGEMEKCLACGMNDFISKPFEETTLIQTIIRHIRTTEIVDDLVEPKKALYDLTKLIQLSRGKQEFITKMLCLFIRELPIALQQIEEAYAQNDLVKVSKMAHRIKPSLDSMGINDLHGPVRALEMIKTGQESEKYFSLIQHIKVVVEEVIQEIQQREDVKLFLAQQN